MDLSCIENFFELDMRLCSSGLYVEATTCVPTALNAEEAGRASCDSVRSLSIMCTTFWQYSVPSMFELAIHSTFIGGWGNIGCVSRQIFEFSAAL